jgi:phosphoenolpyruvate synthase/pyruvate phosphate dikinase
MDSLDIEFAIDKKNNIYLLQVRPLIINIPKKFSDISHYKIVNNISNTLDVWMKKNPYLLGDKGIYGVMPDWNPAEIIGRKPKPLALSLYRELVTNEIWAYQRDNYGYRNLRSFPLLVEIEGCPYIDVRVSFNSFIPKKLNTEISNKLTNYYLQKLSDNPHLHDKIEFDIIFSCTTLTTDEDLKELKKYNFSDSEIEKIKISLCRVTNKIISNTSSLWKKDLKKISTLQEKHEKIINSELNNITKIYWLIEDCKRYGTLPFAGLARTAFIALSILKSLLNKKIISQKNYDDFLLSLETISKKISEDYKNITRSEFIKKYGHLRPGTYDILTKAYQEDFDNYFHWKKNTGSKKRSYFVPSKNQILEINKLLKNYNININAKELFVFIKKSIEAREYAKFIFTKNINSALKIFSKICDNYNIPRSDSAYTHISSIMSLDSSATRYIDILKASIRRRKERFTITKSLNLPHIISNKDDVYYYYEDKSVPNYVTQNIISGEIITLDDKNNDKISGKIVLLKRADPGYDWIFSHNIIGLITKYGGANSHMAIRASELDIPAAIGVGSLYDKLIKTEVIEIDPVSKRILVYR